MRVETIIIHKLIEEIENSRGTCRSVAGFWCWRSHGALTLHSLTDISSLFSTFPPPVTHSQTSHTSLIIFMDDRIADMLGKGKTEKKLQQKCPLEHPCAGENTIKSPLLWQPMECPQG